MLIPFSLPVFDCKVFLYIHSEGGNLPTMFEKLFVLASYFAGTNIYPAWIISEHTYCHKLLISLNAHNIVVLQGTRSFQD